MTDTTIYRPCCETLPEPSSNADESIASNKGKKKNRRSTPAKGFGKKEEKSRSGQKNAEQKHLMVGFGLKFSIGVSKEELESGSALRNVLTRGITAFLKSKLNGMVVNVHTLKMQEGDDGDTTVEVAFML